MFLLDVSAIRDVNIGPFDDAHVVDIKRIVQFCVRNHHKLVLISQFELQIADLVIKFDDLRQISILKTLILIFEAFNLKLGRFCLVFNT